jgi:hypothetical protein
MQRPERVLAVRGRRGKVCSRERLLGARDVLDDRSASTG